MGEVDGSGVLAVESGDEHVELVVQLGRLLADLLARAKKWPVRLAAGDGDDYRVFFGSIAVNLHAELFGEGEEAGLRNAVGFVGDGAGGWRFWWLAADDVVNMDHLAFQRGS